MRLDAGISCVFSKTVKVESLKNNKCGMFQYVWSNCGRNIFIYSIGIKTGRLITFSFK